MKFSNLFIYTLLFVLIIGISCKKKKEPEPAAGITSKYWIQYTLDGSQVTIEDGKNSYSNAASYSSSSSSCNSGYSDVELSGCFFIATQLISGNVKNAIYVTLTKEFPDSVSTPTDVELNAMATVGSYNYFECSASSVGAEVWYVDGNGIYWNSTAGTADQTGSTFALTKVTNDPSYNPNTGGYYNKLTVEGNFSCKVYDGNGNFKTITGGKFNTRLQPL